MAVYTTIDDPEAYFQVKIYTGNGTAIGSGGLALTFDGDTDMAPNLVWIKGRSTTYSHQIYDTIRGVTKRIFSDLTTAEETDTEALTAFGSDGFTLGSNAGVNTSSGTHVAWCWKAGTAFSNDASATSVGNTDSSGSASSTAGFSISKYVGAGSSTDIVVKHGLSVVPSVMITKNLDDANNWGVYHHKNTSAPETDYLRLDTTAATTDDAEIWHDTAPTSAVFTAGDHSSSNRSGNNHIGYFWNEVQGFSKFGSYIGNGNADATFVYTGFRPALIICKNTASTDHWIMFDNKRNTLPVNNILYPNLSGAEESTAAQSFEFFSNGFRPTSNWSGNNTSGSKYIYMAFAEQPFVNSNGVPCNAR